MKSEQATLGGGCFWCLEAIFQRVKGVQRVESGYSGGTSANPSYKEIHQDNDGHAEVIQITFNPEIIQYETILDIFWHFHDPTTLNRQGADVGPAYRSVIFYHNDSQKQAAEGSLHNIDISDTYRDPIVTTIEPYKDFYVAEDYHQNYYDNNSNAPYCQVVINPKVAKFKKEYKDLFNM